MYNFYLFLVFDNILILFKYVVSSFVRFVIFLWYMWINIFWLKIGFISLKRRSFNILIEGFYLLKKIYIVWILYL